jgi:hypothetical protein
MKQRAALLFAILMFGYHAYGEFNPAFSLNTVYTAGFTDANVQSGKFEIDTRKINTGIEATNEFWLYKQLFFKTGLRYIAYKTTVSGLNQMYTHHDKPDPFTWTRKYGALTVPVLLSQHFKHSKEKEGQFYCGVSAGIFFGNFAKTEIRGGTIKNTAFYYDTIHYETTGSGDLLKPSLTGTIDAGILYQPFRAVQQLRIGMMVSYQVNKISMEQFHGVASNDARNLEFEYSASPSQHFLNAGISLVYHLRK